MKLKKRKQKMGHPILKKRKKPILKKRKLPDVFYCPRIKNRLPFPIECSWGSKLHKECKICQKKIIYSIWKNGAYHELNKKLKSRKYNPSSSDIEKEKEVYKANGL